MSDVLFTIYWSLPWEWLLVLALLVMACCGATYLVYKSAELRKRRRGGILTALRKARRSGIKEVAQGGAISVSGAQILRKPGQSDLAPLIRFSREEVQAIEQSIGGILLWVEDPQQGKYTARVHPITDRLLITDRPPQFDLPAKQFPLGLFAGSFTALGLLGTFWGLIEATGTFNTEGTTEQLTSQIDIFVGGLDAAYGTSVVGMALAMLLTLTLSIWRLHAGKQDEVEEQQLEELTQLALPEEELRRHMQEQFEGLAGMAQAIPALATAAESMKNFGETFSPGELAKTITDALHAKLNPVMAALTTEIKNLREEKKLGEADMLKRMLTELRSEVLQPMSAQVMESSRRVQDLTSVVSDLSKTVKSSNEQLAAVAKTMELFQTTTLDKLNNFSVDLGSRLDRFTSSLNEKNTEFTGRLATVFTNFTRDSQAVFAEIPGNVRNALDQVQASIARVLTESSNTQREMLNETRIAFAEQSQQFKTFVTDANGTLQQIQTETVQLLREQTNAQQQTLESLRDNVEVTLSRAREAFDETVTRQQASLNLMNDNLKAQFSRLQELFSEQQANLRLVGQETANTMHLARVELENGIHVIPKMLEMARVEGQQQLQRFQTSVLDQMDVFRKDYQNQLHSFFKQQTVLLEQTLGEQRKGLEQVVATLNSSFEAEYQRRTELGEEVQRALLALAQEVGRTADIQNGLTQYAAEPMVHVSKSLSELNHIQTSLVNQMQSTQAAFVEMQRSHANLYTSLSEQYRSSLSELDTRTQNASRELDQNITMVCKYLTGAANQLATAAALRTEKRS
jgi:hypothetical protein